MACASDVECWSELREFPHHFQLCFSGKRGERSRRFQYVIDRIHDESDIGDGDIRERMLIRDKNLLSYLYYQFDRLNDFLNINAEVLEMDCNNIAALANRAQVFHDQERFSDAQSVLKTLQQLYVAEQYCKLESLAKSEMAYSYSRFGNDYYEQAIRLFDEALTVSPGDTLSLFGLGLMWTRLISVSNHLKKPSYELNDIFRKASECLQSCTKNVTCKSDLLKSWAFAVLGQLISNYSFNYGILYSKVRQKPPRLSLQVDIKSCFRRAISLAQNSRFTLEIVARQLRLDKRHDLAKTYLEKAIQLHPTSRAYQNLALVYRDEWRMSLRGIQSRHANMARLKSETYNPSSHNESHQDQLVRTNDIIPQSSDELNTDSLSSQFHRLSLDDGNPSGGARPKSGNLVSHGPINSLSGSQSFHKYGVEHHGRSKQKHYHRRGKFQNTFEDSHSSQSDDRVQPVHVDNSNFNATYSQTYRGSGMHRGRPSISRGDRRQERYFSKFDHSNRRDSSRTAEVNDGNLVHKFNKNGILEIKDPGSPVLQKVAAFLQESIRLSQNFNSFAMYDLGLTYIRLDKLDDAYEAFHKVTKYGAEKLSVLGNCYEQRGLCLLEKSVKTECYKEDERRAHIEDSKRMFLKSVEISTKIVLFKCEHVSFKTLFNMLLNEQSRKRDKKTLIELADLCNLVNKHRQAIGFLENAREIDPDDSTTVEKLIRNYNEVGDFESALGFLNLLRMDRKCCSQDSDALFTETCLLAAEQRLLAGDYEFCGIYYRDAYSSFFGISLDQESSCDADFVHDVMAICGEDDMSSATAEIALELSQSCFEERCNLACWLDCRDLLPNDPKVFQCGRTVDRSRHFVFFLFEEQDDTRNELLFFHEKINDANSKRPRDAVGRIIAVKPLNRHTKNQLLDEFESNPRVSFLDVDLDLLQNRKTECLDSLTKALMRELVVCE